MHCDKSCATTGWYCTANAGLCDGSYDETCANCPNGWVQPNNGKTSCSACGAGSYDDGDETCANCPSGWVQPNNGKT